MVETQRVCVFCGSPTDNHISCCPYGRSMNAPEMMSWHRGYEDALRRRQKANTEDKYYLCGWERGCALLRKTPN